MHNDDLTILDNAPDNTVDPTASTPSDRRDALGADRAHARYECGGTSPPARRRRRMATQLAPLAFAALAAVAVGGAATAGAVAQGESAPPSTAPSGWPGGDIIVDEVPLHGTRWQLTTISTTGEVTPVPSEIDAHLVVDHGSLSGSSGCNRFTGAAAAVDGQLDVSRLVSTLRACGEPEASIEAAMFGVLRCSPEYLLGPRTLELTSGGVRLVFVAPPPAPSA